MKKMKENQYKISRVLSGTGSTTRKRAGWAGLARDNVKFIFIKEINGINFEPSSIIWTPLFQRYEITFGPGGPKCGP